MATASKKQQQAKSNQGTFLLIGVSVAIVAVGALVIILFGGSDNKAKDGTSALKQFQDATVTGDKLALFPDSTKGETETEIGKTAPTVVGKDFAGNTVNLIEPGKPEMIAFVAHWCPHCNKEVPLIVDWMGTGGNDGVDVIAVATGSNKDNPNWPPSEWLANLSWPGRVIADSEDAKIAQAYGLTGYPLLVFVDANGKISDRMSGEEPITTIQAAIDKIKPAASGTANSAK